MKKRLVIKGMILFCCTMLILSCNKDTVPMVFAPDIRTGQVTDVYRKGATLYGNLQNPESFPVESYGIEYAILSRPGMTIEQYFATAEQISVESADEEGNFCVQLSALEPGRTYLYRSFVNSGHTIVYDVDSSFQTPQNTAPVFGNMQVSNITYTSFNADVDLLDDGGRSLMSAGFIYKEVGEDSEEEIFLGPGIQSVYFANDQLNGAQYSMSIKNLYAGRRYAIRPFAMADGIGYGQITYVQTLISDATLISACDTSNATYNSLHLKASILAENKQYPVEEVGFCYSSENAKPTVAHLTLPATLNDSEFEATISSLNSDTRYYIRAYAKTSDGNYVYGEVFEYTVILHEVLEVSTMPADDISTVGARLWGFVRNNNVVIKERGFCWSMENRLPDIENSPHQLAALSEEESYSLDMEANYNSTYYYRAYAKNAKNEVYYGQVMNFTSEDIGLPQIPHHEAINISESGASIAMTVTLDYAYRDEHPLEYGVLLSAQNADPYLGGDHLSRSYKEVLLSANLEGNTVQLEETFAFDLQSDTKYYYRVYAKNSKDIQYSSLGSFTTPKHTPTQDDVNYPEIQP